MLPDSIPRLDLWTSKKWSIILIISSLKETQNSNSSPGMSPFIASCPGKLFGFSIAITIFESDLATGTKRLFFRYVGFRPFSNCPGMTILSS